MKELWNSMAFENYNISRKEMGSKNGRFISPCKYSKI